MRHDIEVVIDRLAAGAKARPRLAEAVEAALRLGNGELIVAEEKEEGEKSEKGVKSEKGEKGEEVREGKDHRLRFREDASPLREDLRLSSHYACTHCNVSFEPPSPQLFSFNSPQGMCPECGGLGQIYSFDPERLVPDPTRSFQQGCFELLGAWKEMGRWRRHIYRGAAEWLERKHGFEPGTVLETAWEELDPKARRALLWGTGQEHITFTWRSGASGYKWGGAFEGVIPKLLAQYRSTRSRIQRRQLEKYMRILRCPECGGKRLNAQASAVALASAAAKFAEKKELTLPEVCALPICDAEDFFAALELDAAGRTIAAEALKEIIGRFQFLKNVGLDYLTLARSAPTLSGGEMQRIRLAGQIGCGLVGVLYILDEPSIGLHQRDNQKLLDSLARLRDQGNTVIVVEHDEDTMRAADHIVDFGPGPGVRGGRVVAAGPAAAVIAQPESVTGQYLSGAADRDSRHSPQGQRPSPRRPRRATQQPEEPRRGNPPGGVRLRHRRVGLGQEFPGQRHPRRGPQPRPERRSGQPRPSRRHRRRRSSRPADRHRPIADRPHAALEPGDVREGLRRDPQALRDAARVEGPRLCPRPFQLQRRRRAVRGVRGQRREQAGNGLPRRRSGRLPGVRRPSLQPRDAAGPLQGEVDRRSPRNGHSRGPATLRERHADRAEAANAARRGVGLHEARTAVADPFRRRGAAGEARPRTGEKKLRPRPLSPRRADHRLALRRHRAAARGVAQFRRGGQHRVGGRAQSRSRQDGRLDHRSRAGGGRAGRMDRRRGHARASRRV